MATSFALADVRRLAKNRMKAFAVLVAILACVSKPMVTQSRWQSDLAIRRLPPSAFPELSPAIRSALETRHCTIPQPTEDEVAPAIWHHSQNVISGRFHQSEALDWAVLCSRDFLCDHHNSTDARSWSRGIRKRGW